MCGHRRSTQGIGSFCMQLHTLTLPFVENILQSAMGCGKSKFDYVTQVLPEYLVWVISRDFTDFTSGYLKSVALFSKLKSSLSQRGWIWKLICACFTRWLFWYIWAITYCEVTTRVKITSLKLVIKSWYIVAHGSQIKTNFLQSVPGENSSTSTAAPD